MAIDRITLHLVHIHLAQLLFKQNSLTMMVLNDITMFLWHNISWGHFYVLPRVWSSTKHYCVKEAKEWSRICGSG